MTILAISRDWGVSPSTVRITDDATFITITATGYVFGQDANIQAIQKGTFQWNTTDEVLISYANGQGYFTYNQTTGTFVPQADAAGTVTTLTGTAAQVLVNGVAGVPTSGAITLTLPQSIASTSSPTFAALQLTNPLLPQYGGSGIANNAANTQTFSGNYGLTWTLTATTALTLPTSGTLATTSQLVTPAALTKTDDTNITLTLSGSPTTALVNAAGIAAGWTGQLSLTRGGSNASLTANTGGIVYSGASALAILNGTATAGQMLQSGSTAAPAWSTTTYPATNAINTLLYASSANTMAALATANSAGLLTNSLGVPAWVTVTGTGAPVLANTPTLITPVLGAATATSINFGGSTLSNYVAATAFQPTFTCASPGDLSVAYTTQSGYYTLIGNVCTYSYDIVFTPTFTTASSSLFFGGLPFTVNGTTNPASPAASITHMPTLVWPTGCTMLYGVSAATGNHIAIYGQGSAVSYANLTMASLVSGTSYTFSFSGSYFV